MIKEALSYLISLGQADEKHINGQRYSDKPLHLIPHATPDPIEVRNLSGLVDYVQNDFDDQPPVLIHVASPTKVFMMSTYNQDYNRNTLLIASALLPTIPFGRFLDVEEFNILLQSCFVDNKGKSEVLRVVGNIVEENVMTTGDDGVSQAVTAKSGIAQRDTIPVPNPVHLKPFRTFVEISQPESAFVFRMQKGPVAALFEADGGAWKLDAIEEIKKYLLLALAKEIEDGRVTIIA